MQSLIFGSDPELMIVDSEGGYRSAIPIVKGSKERKVDLGRGCKLFYDNVLAELNIAPGLSPQEAINNFQSAFKSAARYVSPWTLLVQSSHTYHVQECMHPDAKIFGCEPECCAYRMEKLMPPSCEENNTFRSAGGHIHLGFNKEEYPLICPDPEEQDWGRVWVVRMMDLFVGIPSLLIDHDKTSPPRRKLYGSAGSHRPKEYGVEYRTLSNFWIVSPKLVNLMYRLSEFVVDFVLNRKHELLWENRMSCCTYDVNKLRKSINDSDLSHARYLMDTIIKSHMPKDLYSELYIASEPYQYNFYKEWGIK